MQGKSATLRQVRALLLSDIHFEPFWDPEKTAQLVDAPAVKWHEILAEQASPDREERFATLEQTCKTRGQDTSDILYRSSLRAMQATDATPKFITVSGDLVAHAFHCKFTTLFPQAGADEYRRFVSKTIEFVLGELRTAFPGVPVYAALGNNDTDCDDYRLDPHSDFLSSTSATFTEGFPAEQRESAKSTFSAAGYYAVSLPAPLEHTQLLVLDDLFYSRRYAACSGKPDAAGATEQLAWLRDQLAAARERKEKIWVMGHIPPGIDPYSTAIKFRDVCGGGAPEMFLSSEDLPDLLAEFGDVIQLAIFGHTHMDEMRFLRANGDATAASAGVAIKMVPSISPINGNSPSFTVAVVDAVTAKLADYKVFTASDQTGINATWSQEYDYAKAYHEPDFSASTLSALIKGFAADSAGIAAPSDVYLRSYYVRDRSLELRMFWPQYVCAMSAYRTKDYKSCRCSAPTP